MERIPESALTTLVALGRSGRGSDTRLLLDRLSRLEWIDRAHWSTWRQELAAFPTPGLGDLFRGLVIAEEAIPWRSGSVAASIWVFQVLAGRPEAPVEALADWALAHSTNPWVPFGGNRIGARTYAEYRAAEQRRAARFAEHLAERQREECRAALWRDQAAAQRRRAADLRTSDLRSRFLADLGALSIHSQLGQLAHDREFPVEWYPTRLAASATVEVLRTLRPEVLTALLEKLRGRHRGPWGGFKRRLLAASR